jgi:hypothetical protein
MGHKLQDKWTLSLWLTAKYRQLKKILHSKISNCMINKSSYINRIPSCENPVIDLLWFIQNNDNFGLHYHQHDPLKLERQDAKGTCFIGLYMLIPLTFSHNCFAFLLIFQTFTMQQRNHWLRYDCAGQPEYIFLQYWIHTAAEVRKGSILNIKSPGNKISTGIELQLN